MKLADERVLAVIAVAMIIGGSVVAALYLQRVPSTTTTSPFTSTSGFASTTQASTTSSATGTSANTTSATSGSSLSSTTTKSMSSVVYAIGVVKRPPAGANYPIGAEYPTGPVFARFRVYDSGWTSPQYTAQQILSMIGQLHPNVLERMTTNTFDWEAPVPVCSGCQPMDYGQFLNASMAACSCYIIPRLDILATWSSGTFFTDAQQILNTPVYPRFEILSIDNWGEFCQSTTCDGALAKEIFSPLYAMGWKGVGVLNAGSPYHSTSGWATFVDLDVDAKTWTVPQPLLNSIESDKTVQKVLLYDPDFPGQAQTFLSACNPTCPDSLVSSLQTAVSQQSAEGYSYVYPIEQAFWDTNQIKTSASGVFGGQTLYQIFREWIREYG